MDELEKDVMASLAGLELVDAIGGPKRIASAASVSPRNGRRWAAGERSNPVYRCLELIGNAEEPFALVALLAARAARTMLDREQMPEWRWRSLYLEACRAEQGPDGAEDEVTVSLLTNKASIADQFAVDRKALAALMRRVVLGFYGIQMRYELHPPKAH